MRTVALVDGFNLYHSIGDLREPHLKWVDLWALCETFAPAPDHQLTGVYYFSAHATWNRPRYARHREYVRALQAAGASVVMSRFKAKTVQCRNCHATWTKHEEKETDVKIAITLVDMAARRSFDKVLVLSQDSDLAPAVRLARNLHPTARVKIVTPVGRHHSSELRRASGGPPVAIKKIHLERCLLPRLVHDELGKLVATRPADYDPPPR